jgi:hypothetical protein
MNFSQVLFDSISSLTGGLVSDLQTALVAMFAIAFICMGIDYLKDCFEHTIRSTQKGKAINEARQYRNNADNATNQVDKDVFESRYRDAIRRAA